MAATGTAAVGFQNRADIIFDMATATTEAAETFSFTSARAGKVIGVVVIAKVANAGGAVDVSVAGNSVVTGVACATANAVATAATINVANQTFAAGTVISIVVKTGGTRGLVIVQTTPTPYADQTTLTAV